MKTTHGLAAAFAALALTVAAAPAGAVAPTTGSAPGATAPAGAPTAGSTSVQALLDRLLAEDPSDAARIEQFRAALPADSDARAQASAAALGIEPSGVQDAITGAILAAIDPSAYQCAPSALDRWVQNAVKGIPQLDLLLLALGHGLDVAAYDAILNEPERRQVYGVDGDWTIPVTHTFRDLKRFWDIDSDGIELTPMHASVWQHPERVREALALLFNTTPAGVQSLADQLIRIVTSTPQLQGASAPLLTANAFAFSGRTESNPRLRALPDKIIMGDGILDIQEALGIAEGGVGARAILAHEFGHHVQYAHDVLDAVPTPEGTRRTELMADALGTYFLVHARGQALNQRRAVEATTAFSAVGDCNFTASQHHGTPLQRERSATWGATLASSARPQGFVIGSLSFIQAFDNALPGLVAPDAAGIAG